MNILITGGAGFIGSNVANYFLSQGHKVTTLDNYSRPGVIDNIRWLTKTHKGNISCIEADVENKDLSYAVREKDVIFHFAAQVGVQYSLENPHHDFLVNAYGTLRLLEAVAKNGRLPLVVFASTNKVYGEIQVEQPVSEKQPLSFCTPYGCSKGCAEQYVLDFSRHSGVRTVVFRMSCVYGTRQFGTEEQGWLCHFMRNKHGRVTVYGDGTQVRDVLFIDDYVRLCAMLVERLNKEPFYFKDNIKGQAFNIGGGEKNVISVNQALERIGNKKVTYSGWRASDQHYYVSDITKIKTLLGWEPQIGVDEGLERLKQWVKSL